MKYRIILFCIVSAINCCILTSCGQSGHLYLPTDSSSQPTHISGKT